ncbi:hypothetical protein GCM10020254_80800 [Streptomyces goshikiensis]
MLLDDLADAAAAAPGGVVDLREHFASRLPWLTVTTLVGLPEVMHDRFQTVNDTVFTTDLTVEQADATAAEAARLLADLLVIKTERPGDDIASALVDAHRQGRLSEREVADNIWMVLGAGYGTTANLLDHAVVNLLTHPAQLDLALSGRVGWDQVVEETLRHQAPVANFMMRFPTEDLYDEATGLTFSRGEALVINYAAVGRDPGSTARTPTSSTSPAPPPVNTWRSATARPTAWAPNSPVSKAASGCPRSSPGSPPSNWPSDPTVCLRCLPSSSTGTERSLYGSKETPTVEHEPPHAVSPDGISA